MQHDVTGAGMKFISECPDIMADIPVGHADTLGTSGSTGCIKHISRAFRIGDCVPFPGRRFNAADFTVRIANGKTAQLIYKRLLRQHKVNCGFLHHIVDAPCGEIRLCRDITSAAFEHRQNGGNHFGPMPHYDADTVNFCREAARNHIHHVGEFTKSHGAAVFNDGRFLSMLFYYFLKKRINRIHF